MDEIDDFFGTYYDEYNQIESYNDSSEAASELIELLKDLPVKINLIPLNEHDKTKLKRPSNDFVFDFQKKLLDAGFVTTVRFSKGRDIAAACGQLVTSR